MGAKRITTAQRETFWACIREGSSVATSAKLAGFSTSSGEALVRRPANGQEFRALRAERQIPDTPVPLADVCQEAKDALADRTGYLFCLRYFGYELSIFQQQYWTELEDSWDTPDREYLCANAPPGLGKSTVLVMFAAKRIVLWRAIRIMFMSRADSLARKNTGRLRRALERTKPAVGAAATLSTDFGRFKPQSGGEIWTRDEYVVEQMDGEPIEEKESTVTAFGFEAEWLGNRIDILFGDDLDSTRSIRNMETVQFNRDVYDGELEPRVGEGGLCVITQQRLGPFDFSGHVLSKMVMPDDDGTDEDRDGRPMYRHITYKVHYEDRCKGQETHRHDAPAYPEGCLLDPRRMPWRDVRKAQNNPSRFKVVYQQEDNAEDEALVQRIWIDGGRGSDGVDYLGCWDKDRDAWELPPNLASPSFGVDTVDPSPTRYWSVQAWHVNVPSEQRFLLDLHRERMDAPDLLDWSPQLGFTGLLEDWWHLYQKLGQRLSHVIVEVNAAQRFMFQYEFTHRWMRERKVLVISHSCVDTETEVLSQRGWLRSHEVVIGDMILTLNTVSGMSEWKPVREVYRGHHEGPMHRYDTRTLDALCTLDHKWPRTDQAMGPIKLVESQDLNTGSVIPLARSLSPEQDPLQVYSDDLVELVGWAVTEGHFRRNPKSPGDTSINIGQSRRANPVNCERIRLLLKRLDARWHESDNGTGTEVSVFHLTGEVARQVRAITDHAKHLPPAFIVGLPSHQRRLLLEVMTVSDGWTSPSGTTNFCSNTESLAFAYELLSALEGAPTYRTVRHPPEVRRDAFERSVDHYVVRQKQARHAYLQNVSNRPEVVDFSGEIWCPSTENGTFYARRGGKTYFTGNTHRNKADPDYGIQMIAPRWQHGQVRLPGKTSSIGRIHALRLVDEVTRWPHTSTDDCVLGQWFLEHNIVNLSKKATMKRVSADPRRPGWAA